MGRVSPKRNLPHRLRIVAGAWRGRYIKVPPHPSVRPTPVRVRETVFNWLAGKLEQAYCLDLYAGSGILGFEAASRGARSVTLVEHHRAIARHLREQAQTLQASQVNVVCADVRNYLSGNPQPVDIVFLDPPFSDSRVSLETACAQLAASSCLKPMTLVYVEAPARQEWRVPEAWEPLKSQQAGQVGYHLFTAATML